MSEFWAEVLIKLLPSEKGGRSQPLDLSEEAPTKYVPHLRVIGGTREYLGVAFMDGPDGLVLPGTETHATIKGLYQEFGVNYDELVEGAEFEIMEGARVVGRGRVTKR